MRRKRFGVERIAGLAEITDDLSEIGLAKMRQHPAVVDVGAPAHEVIGVRLIPEFCDEAAEKKVLRETHAGVGWHFKGAHLDQAQSATSAFRRVKFINAEFGAMGVAAGVNEQIPEQAVHQPGECVAKLVNISAEFVECEFEFVKRVIPGFINAWRLRGGSDEQT